MDNLLKQQILESIRKNGVVATSHRGVNIYTVNDEKNNRIIKIHHNYMHNLCTVEISNAGRRPLINTLKSDEEAKILDACHNAHRRAQTAQTYNNDYEQTSFKEYADANTAILSMVSLGNINHR